MRQPSLFGLLPDLQMPLRDALRGVASFADATEEALEPAAMLLPEPVREGFRDALSAVESAGKRLMTAPIDGVHIRLASDFAAGRTSEGEARDTCATIICYAWEHLQGEADHRLLMSEVLLAGQLGRLPGDPDAGALVATLRASDAIGRMPGVAGGVPEGGRDDVDLALAAIAVWLLSAREDDMAGEARLLDLSHALVLAVRGDVLGAIDTPDRLASILADAAAHL